MASVTDYLDKIVEEYPTKVAYCDGEGEITFSELQKEAYAIADSILKTGTLHKPIIVMMDKKVECIATFMGIAYSGNFYTPIDIQMPVERVRAIINKLSPGLIVTQACAVDNVKCIEASIPILVYEDLQDHDIDIDAIKNRCGRIIDTDILYVLFTSGSTGIPKGVTITHRSVINYVDWFSSFFEITQNSILGNEAPLFFDLSIQDVYCPIKTGCKTVLIDKQKFAFPAVLMKYMCEMCINTIIWVPSALCTVANLRGLKCKELPKLEKVLFCGEVMPNKQLNMWRRAFPGTMFVNMYGPTEACDACAYYIVDREFDDDEPLPIGFPAHNTDIFLLDENDKKIETSNISGEICIRGSALSMGYINDEAKTSEVFVQNPLNSAVPEIIYRTGDIAKYNSKGELEYICRKDFQIKHQGHRIELGEIETAARAVDEMQEVCCVYDSEHKAICLFYVGDVKKEKIVEVIKTKVPHYMLPSRIIQRKELPHNANGKIDRQAMQKEVTHGGY